ncbi:curli assembly protein CsgF [Vibrio sp. SCSIO 43136]|uniref:curli assembly protein CsgF n=1 Tax=Vibrio sp. SCSIO 43136 TaxID=2819101 RepID=UPI002075BE64|nr:curli assembly protein CsgF [Vibrio sp. SCSIO 43136]USD67151.1 curli production assembly protein CsgF [Vibrio sp. SCSIO 43136]
MKTVKPYITASIGLILMVGSVSATELTYKPVNPSFGGNALNSTHLFGVANAINDFKGPDNSSPFEQESALDRLASSLESRLISQLLADVGNGNTGQLETDDFFLNIIDTDGVLTVQIVDKISGESTEIQVSGLNPDL